MDDHKGLKPPTDTRARVPDEGERITLRIPAGLKPLLDQAGLELANAAGRVLKPAEIDRALLCAATQRLLDAKDRRKAAREALLAAGLVAPGDNPPKPEEPAIGYCIVQPDGRVWKSGFILRQDAIDFAADNFSPHARPNGWDIKHVSELQTQTPRPARKGARR